MASSKAIPPDSDASAAEVRQAWQGPRRGRGAFDVFLDHLSPWELIYVRTKACAITVEATKENGFATCETLPPEVLECIAPHLTPCDVLRLRQVSQGWRHCWMNYHVLRTVFQRFYPGILEADAPDPERLLISTMGSYRRKRTRDWLGGFIPFVPERFHIPARDGLLTTSLSLGTTGAYMRRPGPYPFYNEGKVAWQRFNGHVIIDDLRTGKRVRCFREADPRRRQGWSLLVAITGKMVVLASSGPPLPMGYIPDDYRYL